MSRRDGNASQLVGPPLASRLKNVNGLDRLPCSKYPWHAEGELYIATYHIAPVTE